MPPHTLDRQVDTAFALVQHGQIAEAESLCRTLAAEHPGQPMIAFLLGAIAMKMERPAEAARHFQRAIDLDPRIPEFHKTLGDLHLSNHDYDDAIKCLEAAEKLAPEDPTILIGLAHALKGAGRTEEAISAFEAALAADPGHEPAQLALAKYLHDLGRRDDALTRLGKLADQRGDGTFAVTLADWQLPVIPASLADMRGGRQRYEAAVAALATADAPIPESHILQAGTNFHANYQGVDDRRCQEIIAEYYRRSCPALNFRALIWISRRGSRSPSVSFRPTSTTTRSENCSVGSSPSSTAAGSTFRFSPPVRPMTRLAGSSRPIAKSFRRCRTTSPAPANLSPGQRWTFFSIPILAWTR